MFRLWITGFLWIMIAGGTELKTHPFARLKPIPTNHVFSSDTTQAYIERIITQLTAGQEVVISGVRLSLNKLVARLYTNRNFALIWPDTIQAYALLPILAGAEHEGLLKEDYYYYQLLALRQQIATEKSKNAKSRAQFDILLIHGLMLYGNHLYQGKVNPRHHISTWNYTTKILAPNTLKLVQEAIDTQRLGALFDSFKPRFNRAMVKKLRYYRQLAARTSFPVIPSAQNIGVGWQHKIIPLVRQRLYLDQYLRDTLVRKPADRELYDKILIEAVKRFQRLHALTPDGIIGPSTFYELNVPLPARIDQLRVNLERSRWLIGSITPDFVLVNIAGFELYVYHKQKLMWQTDVMTGSANTATPIFQSRFSYIVFNPAWNVPPSIVAGTIWPKINTDPGFLSRNQYEIRDGLGQQVNPYRIHFNQYTPHNFPYQIIQRPGRKNALGQVKFMFPNKYAIYLHDTPSQELFAKAERAFSAGCIRVKDPLKLAEILLADPKSWNQQKIQAAVASGATQIVYLSKRMNLMVMYLTALEEPSGREVRFYRDIYKRDASLLADLNQIRL